MAKAQITSGIVRQPQRVRRIQLELTDGEADFLMAVLSRVDGHEKDSPRKYQRRISAALERATGHMFAYTDAYPLSSGEIEFQSYPDPQGGRLVVARKAQIHE